MPPKPSTTLPRPAVGRDADADADADADVAELPSLDALSVDRPRRIARNGGEYAVALAMTSRGNSAKTRTRSGRVRRRNCSRATTSVVGDGQYTLLCRST